MTATIDTKLQQIHALLAEKGYEVSEPASGSLHIRDLNSGISIQAVLVDDIAFFSLTCTVVPEAALTREALATMLAADNGISTSHFQLYPAAEGKIAVVLNNFCKLQSMGPDDQDDLQSCVRFLLVDVIAARRVLGSLEA